MGNEGALLKQTKKYLKSQNVFYIKFNDKFTYGIPDLCIFLKGRSIWVELKREGSNLRETQGRTIQRIRDSGNEAFVIRSLEEIKMILRRSLTGEKNEN